MPQQFGRPDSRSSLPSQFAICKKARWNGENKDASGFTQTATIAHGHILQMRIMPFFCAKEKQQLLRLLQELQSKQASIYRMVVVEAI